MCPYPNSVSSPSESEAYLRWLTEECKRLEPIRKAERKREERERIRKELEAIEKKHGIHFSSYDA